MPCRDQLSPQARQVQSEDAPLAPVSRLPRSVAQSISPTDNIQSEGTNSLSAVESQPVEDNSASLQAHAEAVEARLLQQRRSYDEASDAQPTPSVASDATAGTAQQTATDRKVPANRSSGPSSSAAQLTASTQKAGVKGPLSQSRELKVGLRPKTGGKGRFAFGVKPQSAASTATDSTQAAAPSTRSGAKLGSSNRPGAKPAGASGQHSDKGRAPSSTRRGASRGGVLAPGDRALTAKDTTAADSAETAGTVPDKGAEPIGRVLDKPDAEPVGRVVDEASNTSANIDTQPADDMPSTSGRGLDAGGEVPKPVSRTGRKSDAKVARKEVATTAGIGRERDLQADAEAAEVATTAAREELHDLIVSRHSCIYQEHCR